MKTGYTTKYTLINTQISDLIVTGFAHCYGENKPIWDNTTITEVYTETGEKVVPDSLQRYEKDAIVSALWMKGKREKFT